MRNQEAAKDNPQFLEALSDHARGTADHVLCVATVLQVPWEEALVLYLEVFKREAEAVLARVTAPRETRKRVRKETAS